MMTHLCRVCTHIYTYINNPWLGFSSRTSTTVYEYTRVSDTSFHADRIISLKLDAVESGGRGGGRKRRRRDRIRESLRGLPARD